MGSANPRMFWIIFTTRLLLLSASDCGFAIIKQEEESPEPAIQDSKHGIKLVLAANDL